MVVAVLLALAVCDRVTAATASSADSAGLEEVVVTARYIKENLQETPLAVTAVTGADLEDRNVPDVVNLNAVVPNLYTHPGDAVNGPTPTISMRGVTAANYSFALEPAVGIYLDDVYHSTLVGSNLDLADIDRVEVKRGPQGTLAGNASIAGTIRIYSKVPKGDDTGYVTASYGSRNEVRLMGAFDTKLTDNLFVRISGQMKRQDGYVDQLDFTCMMAKLGTPELSANFPTADNSAYQRGCKMGTFGGTNIAGTRAVLRYVASDRLEFTGSAAYFKEADEAPAEILVDAHPAPADGFDSVYSAQLFAAYGIVYDNRFLPPPGQPYSAYTTFNRPLSGISFNNSQGQYSTDYTLKAAYKLTDKIDVLGVLGYSNNGGHLHQAGDVSPLGYVQGQVFFNTRQTTAELRFTGTSFADKLDWSAGAFYLKSKNHLSGAIDFVTLNFTEDDFFHDDSKSAFMHGDYHVTDRLSLSAGARYGRTTKDATLNHPPLFNRTIPYSITAGRFDWLASASYKLSDDVLAYASASTGSRPAGITTIVNTIYQLSEYPAEELTAYEAGIKSEWLDHRLRVNLAGFYSDYKARLTTQSGYQCLGQAPPPTRVLSAAECPPGGAIGWTIYISTPGSVRGVELEVTAEPISGLLLNLAGGYNHFVNGVTDPTKPGYLVSGNLPQPETNINAGIQYAIPLAGASITPRLDLAYTSEQTFVFAPSRQAPSGPQDIVPAHTILNGQIAYVFPDKSWTITASGTNLTDKYYFYTLFQGSTVATAGVIAPPREFRLQASHTF